MSQLDIACSELKRALSNPAAVERYYSSQKMIEQRWRIMAAQVSKK